MYLTTRARRVLAVTAATTTLGFSFSGVAYADNINDNVLEDSGQSVSLIAGSATAKSATITLVGPTGAGDGDAGCNIDAGEGPLVLSFNAPTGVSVDAIPTTAELDNLTITACDVPYTVYLKASSTAGSGSVGNVTANILAVPAGGGRFNNNVTIPISVSHPNTQPVVAVTGVENGAEYVIGSVPNAMCDVTDAEQPNEPDFAAALSGTLVNGLGQETATCNFTDNGGLAADTKSVTYTIVPPPNTKPTVAVTGVTNGSSYEIGSVPTAGCAVTDAEDGTSTVPAVITGALSHGLGSQTVTCDATDTDGLAADTATATYTIVDTGDPTISHTVSGTKNSNGWYNEDVTVTFSCADVGGSGIDTCHADGETTNTKTLGEGANQSVTGTATDWAGNTATDTASDIDIDKTDPVVVLVGGPTGDYYYGNDPVAPTCDAADSLSGLANCVVSGGGNEVGSHTWTATATDKAGNTATAEISYTVKAWEHSGFYAPVDMNGVWNSVKGGSTVPLKFEIFNGARELTNVTSVKSFVAKAVSCPGSSATVDNIETVLTGGTTLRYDSTGGQFIQNWQTPKKPGTCATATITTQDGSTISANFMFR